MNGQTEYSAISRDSCGKDKIASIRPCLKRKKKKKEKWREQDRHYQTLTSLTRIIKLTYCQAK